MTRTVENIREQSGLFDKRMALTTKEVAQAIGRSEHAVHILVNRRAIPFRKVGGRLVFIPEEIRDWLHGKGASDVS